MEKANYDMEQQANEDEKARDRRAWHLGYEKCKEDEAAKMEAVKRSVGLAAFTAIQKAEEAMVRPFPARTYK